MILKFLENKKFTIILVLIILILIICAGYMWYEDKMNLVEIGLAKPNFPFRKYNLLELARQGKITDYTPELEAAVKNLPTRTTPKESLKNYIQALKNEDIENALDCCVRKELYHSHGFEYSYEIKESEKSYLSKIKEEGKLKGMIEYLEKALANISWDIERIEKNSTGKTNIYYRYSCISNGQSATCGIGFVKDFYGDWRMDKAYY